MEPIQSQPATTPDNGSDLVTVSHCSTLNEAQMVVSLLDSFGIEATIDAENFNRMFGSMVPSTGGVQVQVRRSDVEASMEILNQNPGSTTLEE